MPSIQILGTQILFDNGGTSIAMDPSCCCAFLYPCGCDFISELTIEGFGPDNSWLGAVSLAPLTVIQISTLFSTYPSIGFADSGAAGFVGCFFGASEGLPCGLQWVVVALNPTDNQLAIYLIFDATPTAIVLDLNPAGFLADPCTVDNICSCFCDGHPLFDSFFGVGIDTYGAPPPTCLAAAGGGNSYTLTAA